MTRKGITAILNNGIEFFIGSLVLILVTMLFSTEEAGAWIVFLTIVLIGTKFREGITQNSLMKFTVGRDRKEKTNVYVLSILITLVIEISVGFLIFLASRFYEGDTLGGLLANYIWLIVPQSLFRLFQFMSLSRLEVKSMLASNLVLLNITVLLLAFIALTRQPFANIPAILGIGYAITLLWQVFMHNVFNWEFKLKEIHIPQGYLNFAGNGLLRELFGTISSKAYILLTAGFIGYTESAFVGIASRYANLIYLPNTAYQGLLYPKACEFVNNGWVQAMFKYYRRAISWMQAAFIPYVILLLTIGSAGIVLLHSEEYVASIPFFMVLILAGAFISPYGHAFGSICHAMARPDLVTKIVVFNSCLNISLSLILIQLFGVWGAVMSPIFTDIIGLFIISVVLKKVFNTSILEPFTRILGRSYSITKIIKRNLSKREVVL